MVCGHEGWGCAGGVLRVLRLGLIAIVHCNDAMTVKEKREVWGSALDTALQQ